MSIKLGLLVLLHEQAAYGSQLRAEFERRTGGVWPLNIGQVYTTLARLQRDGLVAEADRRPDGTVLYALTDQGRAQARQWWSTPVPRTAPARDELAIKLALAVTTPGVDVAAVVQHQRAESMRSLQEYTRLKLRLPEPPDADDLAWSLVLESLIFSAEAEVRWLDHVEQRLARLNESPERRPRVGPSNPEDGTEAVENASAAGDLDPAARS